MIGFINYFVILLIVTGALILIFDVRNYAMAKMNKEARVSQFLGWLNVALGIIVFSGNWAYQAWFW